MVLVIEPNEDAASKIRSMVVQKRDHPIFYPPMKTVLVLCQHRKRQLNVMSVPRMSTQVKETIQVTIETAVRPVRIIRMIAALSLCSAYCVRSADKVYDMAAVSRVCMAENTPPLATTTTLVDRCIHARIVVFPPGDDHT